jgi:CPA2 family monovalent cation:H+ antiporter-2
VLRAETPATAATAGLTLGLLEEITILLVLAFVFGWIASRLRMPPIVGYLTAGLLIGPFTPGFTADTHLAKELGDVGIVILMFGVGLHFSLRDLLAVKNISIPGALVQSVFTTLLGIGAATLVFGWSVGAGLVLGLALSVASTVVLVRALSSRDKLDAPSGRIAVGWLVVEDIFSVLVLVLLPIVAVSLGGAAGGGHGEADDTVLDALLRQGDSLLFYSLRSAGLDRSAPLVIAVAFANVALLAGLVLGVGKRATSWVLAQVDAFHSDELFTLTVVVLALFVAVAAKTVFGLSDALGAFLAGVMIAESPLAHRIAEEIRPIRDIFGIVFFAAVGMLLNPAVVIGAPIALVVVLLIVVLAKPAIAAAIVLGLKQPLSTAGTIAPGLGQVGEFSFILAVLGKSLDLLPDAGYQLIICGAIISIALNPILFRLTDAVVGKRTAGDEVVVVPA